MADPAQITQVITELPVAPAEGSGFRAKAATFLAALVTFAQQLIAFCSQANAVAVETNAHALTCASNASLAHTAAADAVAALAGINNQADIATTAAAVATDKATAAGVAKTGAEAARDIALAAAADVTGIQPSIGTARGDLIGFSAAGTPVRLPAGANGQTLKSDSTAVLGLVWGDVESARGVTPTQITNALIGVWSNGTLESAVSSINLIDNGEEWLGAGGTTPPTGWSQLNAAAFTLVTGLAGTYALQITNNGASNGQIFKSFATTPGHVYKAAMHGKVGTETAIRMAAGTASSSTNLGVVTVTASTDTRVELIFEAIGTTTYITLYNGGASGATGIYDEVSMYDMGPNLVQNGTFNTNATGWTANSTETLASVSGGIDGNCLSISGVAGGYAKQQVTGLTIGKLYRLGVWIKSNGSNAARLWLSHTAWGESGGELGSVGGLASTWTMYLIFFEASATTLNISAVAGGSTAAFFFDSITTTEVTVGCVDYNSKALDLWNKDWATKCWRETIQTKGGSYYALRVYGGCVYWSDGGRAAQPEFYSRYADAGAVVKGMWVKSSVANAARIGIQDSAGTTWSAYHPGDGAYHWLTVTRSPAAGITSFQTIVDSGAGAEAIFSQPQLQPGATLGDGCFVPIQGEWIYFETEILSQALSGKAFSSGLVTIQRATSDANGAIPRFVRSVSTYAYGGDSVSQNNLGMRLIDCFGNYVNENRGNTGQSYASVSGISNVVKNGSFELYIFASGTNTFTVFKCTYNGVQL